MSPYFPYPEETAYRCKGCGGWFIPGNRSCLVAHPPGTCCHKYEKPVQSQVAPTIYSIKPLPTDSGPSR